ncbi:MAG: hypothetical protein JWN76_329 [Chitinophagaceae bacterium]|nr:hypothetical protein [Chitinophagaceae bacterium]
MKKIFLSLALITLLVSAHAQTSGTVTYDRVTDRWRRITDEQMRAMIPQIATAKFQLVFSESMSVYKMIPDDNTPDPFASGGPRIVMRNPADNAIVFRNIAELKQIEQRDMGDNTYLVTDSIKQQPWKLTGETKTILGHVCKKATMENTVPVPVMRTVTSGNGTIRSGADTSKGLPPMQQIEVVAWYAEDMPSPVGPGVYASLPGVILQVDVNKGETVLTATAIKPAADKKDLAEPKKGKKISREDFIKKQNEMMSNFQGGNIRIGG